MVTELTPAQAPPATNQPPCPRHPTPWQVINRQFETLRRGLVRQAIFPLRRFDHQKLEERVATLIQRKPALPALRKLLAACAHGGCSRCPISATCTPPSRISLQVQPGESCSVATVTRRILNPPANSMLRTIFTNRGQISLTEPRRCAGGTTPASFKTSASASMRVHNLCLALHSRSNTAAIPWPPPTHIVTSAKRPPMRCSS